MLLETLAALSNRYGSDPALVLAGGGNTSVKDGGTMYVKASGTALATIRPQEFAAMDRAKLAAIMEKTYPVEDEPREAAALADLMDARLPGQGDKRPSVETLLHALFPERFVLHLHPARVNGMTCGKSGEAAVRRLFPDAVWIELCKPGYILAKLCQTRMAEYKSQTGKNATLLFLQNHGVFFAADTPEELDRMLTRVIDTLRQAGTAEPDFTPCAAEDAALGAQLAVLYSEGAAYTFCGGADAVRFSQSREALEPVAEPFSPDHIVYCKAYPLYLEQGADIAAAFGAYRAQYGYAPKLVYVQNGGFYTLSDTLSQAQTARLLAMDAVKIAVYSRDFGGALPMTPEMTDFIVNWEVEAYRAKRAQ